MVKFVTIVIVDLCFVFSRLWKACSVVSCGIAAFRNHLFGIPTIFEKNFSMVKYLTIFCERLDMVKYITIVCMVKSVTIVSTLYLPRQTIVIYLTIHITHYTTFHIRYCIFIWLNLSQ